jgi:hypothetical protein
LAFEESKNKNKNKNKGKQKLFFQIIGEQHSLLLYRNIGKF